MESQAQEKKQTQAQYRQIRPTAGDHSKKCSYCGGLMSMTAEICPHCGRPTNPDVCSFCGAMMDPSDRFCPECGNSREGIVCPECGTLNFRSFCRKCNHPLDHMAQAAIAQAQADPKFQRMVELQQRMVELERQILDGADKALSEADESLKQQYDALLAMISGGVSEKQTEAKVTDEGLKQMAQEYRESVQQMNAIMADLMPDAGMTPQEQRNYFCARKLPVITVTRRKEVIQQPVEWICNYCGCHHSQPSDCVEPQLGGTWVYENIEVEEVITEKHWVTE